MSKRILFISHDASRTGAPLILLHFIKWLRNRRDIWQLDILLLGRGKIEKEFNEVSFQLFDFTNAQRPLRLPEMLAEKTLGKIGIIGLNREERLYKQMRENNYDLIYANSIVSLPIGVRLKKMIPRAKLLVHVHELNTIIKMSVPNLNELKQEVDKFIAVSEPVKENLIENWSVNPEKIALVHEFAVVECNISKLKKTNREFIVGSSGSVHWRKGSDVFLMVASYIFKNFPEVDIKFRWIGSTAGMTEIVEEDIRKLNLNGKVEFSGEVRNPGSDYMEFDLFLLTSREDPFPLVCIEMAALEKPIICFEKASGTANFILKGGGYVVPYLDIEAMAEKIIYYYKNPERAVFDGQKNKLIFSGFTRDEICPEILVQIEQLL